MRKHRLTPHPATPPQAVTAVDVEVRYDVNEMLLSFIILGGESLLIPEPRPPARADGLWRTTCFECFLQPVASAGYQEFNASPSGQWAAYAFDKYRHGMRDLSLTVEPWVGRDEDAGPGTHVWDVDLDLTEVPGSELRMGLSAVVVELDGTKSYWALAHPPGAPDFHHPDCFTAELPPPPRA